MALKYLVPKKFNGTITTVFNNGVCEFSKLPLQEYFESHNLNSEDFSLVDPADFDIQYLQPFLAGKQLPWEEVSEDHYFEMLCVLPPTRRHFLDENISIFFVDEPVFHSLYRAFIRDNRTFKFYSAIRDINIPSPKLLENFLTQFPNP